MGPKGMIVKAVKLGILPLAVFLVAMTAGKSNSGRANVAKFAA